MSADYEGGHVISEGAHGLRILGIVLNSIFYEQPGSSLRVFIIHGRLCLIVYEGEDVIPEGAHEFRMI